MEPITEVMPPDRWLLAGSRIVWDVRADRRLPHEDHLEMSGRKVSLIVRYRADSRGRLSVSREVIWPMLRLRADDVRGYLRRTYDVESEPAFTVNGRRWKPGPLEAVVYDGALKFFHRARLGIVAYRTIFPSTNATSVFERWTLDSIALDDLRIDVAAPSIVDGASGVYGEYRITVGPDRLTPTSGVLRPLTRMELSVAFRAHIVGTHASRRTAAATQYDRIRFCSSVERNLVLDTPDPVLNEAFSLAKLRAAESVFDTKMGLVHSPGGGRYYGGIWANDQAEYSGPFFPFLGEPGANKAALNAYRIFAQAMDDRYEMLPSSFEVEGDVRFHAGGDRGDAAMVAYGCARYALANGDRGIGEELWPAVTWCLEYCRRKTNAAGVVESDTDELEGRFPTGKANLSTSMLTYGALDAAAYLAAALGRDTEATTYRERASDLRAAIERYFGAVVEGYHTYRYYDGNTVLRSWICLPLVMGIDERREETVRALLSPRLWTEDGLATQAGDTTFWDRSTLYALRGVFAAGATEAALRCLTDYTRRRLLGDHVPYPVEAHPEGGQAHLSAESALYCRAITEGLFGIVPTGFRSFRCAPRLPQAWKSMALHRVGAFGGGIDLRAKREKDAIRLHVRQRQRTVFDALVGPDGCSEVELE